MPKRRLTPDELDTFSHQLRGALNTIAAVNEMVTDALQHRDQPRPAAPPPSDLCQLLALQARKIKQIVHLLERDGL